MARDPSTFLLFLWLNKLIEGVFCNLPCTFPKPQSKYCLPHLRDWLGRHHKPEHGEKLSCNISSYSTLGPSLLGDSKVTMTHHRKVHTHKILQSPRHLVNP